MRDLPLVSIITPAYNQAEYLAETINSILAQTYPNIEYIVLDDGSKDNTREVLERYDGKIRWESHDNMGQARTLNKGWAMSSGSIVGYLSSDDRLLPHAISTLVEKLQATPSAVAVYCDFDLIDASGRITRSVKTEDFDERRLVEDLVCQPGPGALFFKTVLDQVGAWKPELRQIPDFEFWLRASKCGSFVRVSEPLAHYRIHESSASFSSMPIDRAEEISNEICRYWLNKNCTQANKSISKANIIVAKNHAQSGRYKSCIQHFIKAIKLYPKSSLYASNWRIVFSGIARRFYYSLTTTTKIRQK